MPENIDTAQASIGELEKKTEKEVKDKDLAEKLKQNHETFFAAVDSAQQTLTEGESSLTNQASKKALSGLGDDIQSYLQQVAATGEYIYSSKDTRGVEKISVHAGKINDRVKEIRDGLPVLKACDYAEYQEKTARENFLDTAATVKQTGEFGGEKLTPERKREVIMMLADKAIDELAPAKKQVGALTSVPEIFSAIPGPEMDMLNTALEDAAKLKLYYETQDFAKQEKYANYFIFLEDTGEVQVTEEFKKLPEEEQAKLLLDLKGVKMRIMDDIGERCATGEEEKRFFNGKTKMAAGELSFAKDDFLAYLKFLEGKGGKSPDEIARQAECKEYLKQIAKMDLALARQKLNLMRESLQGRVTQMTNPGVYDVGVHFMVAKINLDQMDAVLKIAENDIERGLSHSIEEVTEKLRAMDSKSLGPYGDAAALRNWQKSFEKQGYEYDFFDPITGKEQHVVVPAEQHAIFDVLQTQCDLSSEKDPRKREEKILALAKEAREMGLPALARHYYDQYFAKEIEQKTKEIDKAEFTAQMRQNTDLLEQLRTRMEALKPELQKQLSLEWTYKFFPDGITAQRQKELDEAGITFGGELDKIMNIEREKAFTSIVDQEYLKVVKTAVHHDYKVSDMSQISLEHGVETGRYPPGSKGYRIHQWNEAYGDWAINLENFDKKWYEKWRFTDEEWNHAKPMIIIEIAALFASAGVSSLAARAVVGEAVVKRLIANGVTDLAISEACKKGTAHFAMLVVKELGFKEALTYGLGHFIVDNGVYTIVKGAIDETYKPGSPVYTNPAEFFKRFGMNCLLTGPMLAMSGTRLMAGPATSAFAKIGKQLEKVKDTLTPQQLMALSFRASSGKEISMIEFQKILADSIIF